MREILFRGKRKDNGEWVYGSCIVVSTGPFIIEEYESTGVWVDPKTVSEFTGLTDRMGNNIFENDIVKADERIGEVRFVTGAFVVHFQEDLPNEDLDVWVTDGLEIIGNCHDNPELLKKEQEESNGQVQSRRQGTHQEKDVD
ncbi:MAG: YopX family protein [Treponema sp.]|jgi:uncharacterized phage protein (TIGR01671 family)|nr:YopX family protein [Treponema sp.]